MFELKTGWRPVESCPRDREVTLWATDMPAGENPREINGYYHHLLGFWVAAENDGINFTLLYPKGWRSI